jgi:uncharacterized protein (TIGR03437 family)
VISKLVSRHSACWLVIVNVKLFTCLMLFSVTGAMGSSSTGFLLGVKYSEWLNYAPNTSAQIATDSSGSLYILSGSTSSTVTKLSADGKTILWQNQLGFVASVMAVDPGGGVYVIPVSQLGAASGDTSVYVAKLGAGGTGLAWTTSAGFTPMSVPVLAADSQGRAYVAAQYITNNFITQAADVVRLNAAGSGVDYTAQVMGIPSSIAVSQSGAAFVAGTETNAQGVNTGFLAQVAPDGSPGFYSILPLGLSQTVALDANGNVVVFGSGVVERINSTGAVTLSTTVGGSSGVQFALDAAGNAYVTVSTNKLYAVHNSLATCGFGPSAAPPGYVVSGYAQLLTVAAPDGSILQTTYIPGGNNLGSPIIATGPNSTVFVAATAGPGFAPTQAGPFPAGSSGGNFLTSFSPNAGAPTYSLDCMGSSASLATGAIAPGEIVTLFGNGLGPQQGVQPQATVQSPYPTQAANVEVTFDGTPAPLLWVQDVQINAVAPWSLTPGQTTQVCVSYNGVPTNCLAWPVVQTVPAVFTVDGTYAAALNQDGTLNSANNPAAVGSIVSVWATGLGPIAPPQADGTLIGLPLPNNVLAVGVTASYGLGIPYPVPENVPFAVSYAGPAPDLVAGASQINFQVGSFPSYGAIYLTLPSSQSPAFEVFIAGQ